MDAQSAQYEWKLFDANGQHLRDVNCQYDALDIAVLLYGASTVTVDFESKSARIVR